jgi:hypothetical protein
MCGIAICIIILVVLGFVWAFIYAWMIDKINRFDREHDINKHSYTRETCRHKHWCADCRHQGDPRCENCVMNINDKATLGGYCYFEEAVK